VPTPKTLAALIADADPVAPIRKPMPILIAGAGSYALEFLLFDEQDHTCGMHLNRVTWVQTVAADIRHAVPCHSGRLDAGLMRSIGRPAKRGAAT